MFAYPVSVDANNNFVSLSLIMDAPSVWNETYYTKLCSFLSNIGYKNWTFCVWDTAFNIWIDNTTRLNKLKEYGVLIPRLAYMQLKNPSDRLAYVDEVFDNWSSKVGYYPSGVFDYIPDTYTANYIYDKYNCTFWQGYCFDQYRIDYMSMRGGWQLPYYADAGNILVPKHDGKSLVVLPHSLWDWKESFLVSHEMHLHPMNLIKRIFNEDVDKAKNYFLKLIDYNAAACSPFSYTIFQFEWCWCCSGGYKDEAEEWIKTLLNYDYTFVDFEEFTSWFLIHYENNPAYEVNFCSPYSSERIEWYWCVDYRVARVGDKVVSYVVYGNQSLDHYMLEKGSVNWSLQGTPCSADNQVDISLMFEIDALGGGKYRAPVVTSSYSYSGGLDKFPLNFHSRKNAIDPVLLIFLFLTFIGVGAAFVIRSLSGRRARARRAR